MSDKIPNGLVFAFKSSRRKKRALILVIVLISVQIGMIWPVYPLFSSPTPQFLGFPLSIVWVVAMLLTAATAVFIFFRKDINEED